MANLLIESAYEAEIEASQDRVILRSWDEVGLYPFQADKIWKRANESLGGAVRTECQHIAHTAARLVIDGHRQKKARVVSGRSEVRMNQLFSPEALLQAHEELSRSSTVRVEETTCRIPGCGKRSRGGKAWAACPCGSFKLCTKHRLDQITCSCIASTSSSSPSENPQSSQPALPVQVAPPTLSNQTPSEESIFLTESLPVVCIACHLLITDPEGCSFCAHRGFSATVDTPENDSDINSPSSASPRSDVSDDEELEPALEIGHPSQGVCEV